MNTLALTAAAERAAAAATATSLSAFLDGLISVSVALADVDC